MSKYDTTIGKIADIFDGPHATPNKTDSGPCFLNISSLRNGRLDLSKSICISDEDYPRWTKRIVPLKGDLLFSYETRLGEAALMPEGIRACLGRRMGLLRPRLGIVIPEYLLYSYLSPKFQHTIIKNTVRGATVDRLLLSDMSNFPIRIPPLGEQIKVSHLLTSLDAKIELNKRINAELEAMAKTLYDFWFVQFDFPCPRETAIAQGKPDLEGKPYKSSGGRMVWNAELKREIPEGWKVGILSDIALIVMGQLPDGSSYNGEGNGICFYQGCTDFGARFPTVRQFSDSPTRYAETHDILLSVRAPVGTLNIANEKCCIGRGLAALRSKTSSQTYLYSVLSDFKEIFDRRNAGGTTFGAITKDDLYRLKVIQTPQNQIGLFEMVVKSIFEKQNEIEIESRELTALRDWLLPMLMNGQVEVS